MTEQASVSRYVALYCRTSTESQSPGFQLTAARRVLQGVPADNIKTYVDLEVSANRSMTERPQLQALMHDITRNKVSRVVVYSRDRIARQPWKWMEFWHLCITHHVAMDFTRNGTPPMSQEIFNEMLWACLIYDEGQRISQRTCDALALKKGLSSPK